MKTCTKCSKPKELKKFAVENRSKDGRRSACKDCLAKAAKEYNKNKPYSYCAFSRRSKVLAVYGLTIEAYDEMLNAQNHQCKICGIEEKYVSKQRFHVDHCHDTGVVRGLLCSKCNNGLGMFQDSPDFLIEAAKYLKPFKE